MNRMSSYFGCLAAACAMSLALGCQPSASSSQPEPSSQELVIFAAASLREPFGTLADVFSKAHPETKVTFNFAGSQELRLQVEQGASADVFASADHEHADALVKANRLEPHVTFIRNAPVLVISKRSKRTVKSLAELPSVEHIVLGLPEVPIGRYSNEILERAHGRLGVDFRSRVEAKVSSREPNVKQVLAKVRLGEADAAIVYRSDAQSALDQVNLVMIPAELNVIAEYPIGIVRGTKQRTLARAWIDLTLSDTGQRILRDAGFDALTPP